LLAVGFVLIALALFLRPVSGDAVEKQCNDIAARAMKASTPGPRSHLDFVPPTEEEMNILVKCLEKRLDEKQ
jgi:hypothetical protein